MPRYSNTLPHRFRPFLSTLLLSLLITAPIAGNAAPLESAASIRALTPEQAAQNLPVVLEAQVTFRDPAAPTCLAHDGHEGVYVELPRKSDPAIQSGARLRIEGTTKPGGFLPIIHCERATVLGQAPLPEPRQIAANEIFSPSLDCQWVQVPAIITGVDEDKGLPLIAEVSGWTVKVVLPPSTTSRERVSALMQSPVMIRGVVGSVFNANRQLTGRHFFVPSLDELIPSDDAGTTGEAQLRGMDELLRSDATARTRVRVRGVVTHAASDGLYLRGKGGSVFVRAADAVGLAPGTKVEAEGFAAVASFRPILRASRLTRIGQEEAPKPQTFSPFQKSLPQQQQAELVTLAADLLALREGPANDLVLQCRSSKWFFEASLSQQPKLALRVEPGDRLQLTGICELTTTQSLPFANNVDGFRLHLRDAADVTVLQSAPWWTLQRVLWVLGIVATVALVALAWAALLRRRVSEQTEIIKAQIERSAVKDERQRIARELHDTIEQELAGLSVQLRNARQRLANSPEQASNSLDLAEKMLRHCRAEARTSIRDLRSVALEQRGLHGALEEFLAPLAAECGAKFSLTVEGEPRSLSGPVEIHLLRIAHEAVANAARHADPESIHTRLVYAANTVTVEVKDDGSGFDPNAPAPRGHFGILGMQERANKLHATLAVESSVGGGTTVRVTTQTLETTPAIEPIS